MSKAAPGEWYISVVCELCSHRVLIFYDISEGKSDVELSRFHITCPKCQKEGSYIAEQYQVPLIRQASTLAECSKLQ